MNPGTQVFAGLPSPVMVIKNDALNHNITALARYSEHAGALLAPHGKTTMSPQIIGRQRAAGAWAVTAATGHHVRAYRSFGVPRILLANELTDPAAISWVAAEMAAHPEFEFCCYADSAAGVALLEQGLATAPPGVRFDVLVEAGYPGGRTGCRSADQAMAVARLVAGSGRLRLAGVAGYEGTISHDRDAQTLASVAGFCDTLGKVAAAIDSAGLFEPGSGFVMVTAGGSIYYDVVARQLAGLTLPRSPVRLVLRPGSYVTHDHGADPPGDPLPEPWRRCRLEPALEIWGRVLSRPEPGAAYADFGRRDVPFDIHLPRALTVRGSDGSGARGADGITVTGLNDQHAYLSVPHDDPLAPGDWLGCGVFHPCTAFDKWRALPIVDRAYRVVDTATTCF